MQLRLSTVFVFVGSVLCAVIFWPSLSHAVEYEVGLAGGTMQQPTSEYYHAVYGGYLGLSGDSQWLMARLAYTERPKFSAAGFVDQEAGAFALIGTRLTQGKTPYGMRGWVGAGQMQGYIKPEKADLDLPTRTYELNGLVLMAEAYYRIGRLDLALALQNFTGFVNHHEFDSRVAWPFNFFTIQLGMKL